MKEDKHTVLSRFSSMYAPTGRVSAIFDPKERLTELIPLSFKGSKEKVYKEMEA
jgi:hypothetical protein